MPAAVDLAALVASALGSNSLDDFAALLAPDVTWGPPGDTVSGCRGRAQVLAWYQRSHRAGVTVEVTEVATGDAFILVGLAVSGRAGDGGARAARWQVLTVRDGQVAAICGFDDRADAARWAGLPPG